MDGLTEVRMREILAATRDARVLVVGDVMLDRYVTGTVERISPEAPVPVVRVEGESCAVGGAANVAANVAALGASCTVVGIVGHDAAGERLRHELGALGVRTEGLVATGHRPTTEKTRVLARHQQVVRFDHEVDADISGDLARDVSGVVADLLASADVLVLEDYNKGVLVAAVIRPALQGAATAGISSVVDPKRRNFFEYGGASVFKPNAKELADALGDFIHPDDPEWMEATRRRLDCEHLLLTLGEHGMALQTSGRDTVRLPTVARAVYDVSGAGDTVTAVMAVALSSGASVEEAALLANHAAAVEVGKVGVATVSPAEILEHARAVGGTPGP